MTNLQALLYAHQDTRLLRLSFPMDDGPQAKLMVNRFVGTEYLSRDFEFKLDLLSDDAAIELEAMHGKLLCVSLVQAAVGREPGATDLVTTPISLESQMSLKIITVGDKTDHGGTVISGSANHDIRGRAIARLGDQVACPLLYPGGKPHGINKIITGHSTLTVNEVPVAVEGCTTECGCKLIGSLPATVG